MSIISIGLIALIALIHFYIMWFEMFKWTSRGPKVFKEFPETLFEPTVSMAGNQGLYNGFLGAGLVWSLVITDSEWKVNVAVFFLVCIAIAGVYGMATASKKIIFVQTVPAVLALASLWLF